MKGDYKLDDINSFFSNIYNETYPKNCGYVVVRIKDVHDANDVLQTIYTSLYIRICNKGIIQSNDVLKILYTSAKHEIGRYYGFYHYKRKCISLDANLDQSIQKAEIQSDEFISEISNDKSKELLSDIWEYIKAKDELTYRIFLLHYVVGYKI